MALASAPGKLVSGTLSHLNCRRPCTTNLSLHPVWQASLQIVTYRGRKFFFADSLVLSLTLTVMVSLCAKRL